MKTDVITLNSVQSLVDCFYTKVRSDDELGPVFIQAIGESDEEWSVHLETMYRFWSTLMYTTGCYEGRHLQYKGMPVQKHQKLPIFAENLFDRWLALFHETAREFHNEKAATHYIEASERVAKSLKLSLYYKPEVNRNEKTAR